MTEPSNMSEHDTESDHMVETPETLRDDDSEAMPMDRGNSVSDRPLGSEKFGTTHSEAERGAPLDSRLAEEMPEEGAHDPVDDIVADYPAVFAGAGGDTEQTDDEVLADAYGQDREAGGHAGRLVEPDEGAHTDTEADMIASDVGRDGGDESPEEGAMQIEDGR